MKVKYGYLPSSFYGPGAGITIELRCVAHLYVLFATQHLNHEGKKTQRCTEARFESSWLRPPWLKKVEWTYRTHKCATQRTNNRITKVRYKKLNNEA